MISSLLMVLIIQESYEGSLYISKRKSEESKQKGKYFKIPRLTTEDIFELIKKNIGIAKEAFEI